MKKILYLVFGIILVSNLNAQTIKTHQKIVTIIPERAIYLNGGARASMGGLSRTTIEITLPPNTKSWYYSFSTTAGASGTDNLNLAAQLSSLLPGPLGLTSAILSTVKLPSGLAGIDVYVFDLPNSNLFMRKVDNNGGTFYCYREHSTANTKQAIVDINDLKSGTYYIGLKNPSSLSAVNVQIEVVALVEEAEEATQEQSEAVTMGSLGWKAFERGDYDRCIELSKKALGLDSTLGYIHFNIALSLLMKGQNTEALEVYTKAIAVTKKTSVPKRTFEGAINDLNTNMEKFPSKADAQDILDILTEEAKKY